MKTLAYIAYTIGWCIGAVLWLHYTLFVFLTSVMVFDTVTWVAKWVRLWSFSSHRLTRWLISKIFIITLVLFFSAGSHHVFPDILWDDTVLWLLIGMLVIAEFISTIQNIIIVHSWQQIEEYDAVSYVLHRILSLLRDKLENIKK